eukprot:CAMPEP_0204275614 /NCGR_PEP_ID=MMETSP0468-20130131/26359_1 /ASSEMBLY_ACC=CAM_ASM_000383 /TAXON_ID=2969 /ORGANISM="Oxyrrhis marina" /LENGTH=48 /DNA_ID= /DNA_START= /DNA_END= /DNA_ORIENTATION=
MAQDRHADTTSRTPEQHERSRAARTIPTRNQLHIFEGAPPRLWCALAV